MLPLLPLLLLVSAQTRQEQVDRVFAQYSKPGSPGCAVGVVEDGQLVVGRGYGLASIEHNAPLTTKTVLNVGSVSKQFTAMSIALLAADGKLSLDDPVRKHIPELPAYPGGVTIRHLLQHTGGLRDFLELTTMSGRSLEDTFSDEDGLRLITRQRELNFTPGGEYLYSNSGYFLASQIVRRVSGKSLRAFAAERIFGPLGMTASRFRDDHREVVAQRATGYAFDSGAYRISMSNRDVVGSGGLETTVEDLLLWDRHFYEPKFGSRALLDTMQSPGRLNNGQAIDYALGLTVSSYRGLKTVGHAGSWAGYRAMLLRFPEQKFSVICLCNLATANPPALAEQVADVWLGDRMQKKPEPRRPPQPPKLTPATLTAEQLGDFAGEYWSDEVEAAYVLRIEGGKLEMRNRNTRVTLDAFAGDSFRGSSLTLRFFRDPDDDVAGFRLSGGRARNIQFNRKYE